MVKQNKNRIKVSNEPIHVKRRRVAGGIASLVAAGSFMALGGGDKAAAIMENAKAPHGREIPMHPVTIENAGGVEGGTMVVMQGNSPKAHPDTEIRYESFIFGASKNNVKAATDTLVPDEDITKATEGLASYLPKEDRDSKTVYPNQKVVVAIDMKKNEIIPANELTPDQKEEAHYIATTDLSKVAVSSTTAGSDK